MCRRSSRVSVLCVPVLALGVGEGLLEVGVEGEEDEREGDVAGQGGQGALVHATHTQTTHHLMTEGTQMKSKSQWEGGEERRGREAADRAGVVVSWHETCVDSCWGGNVTNVAMWTDLHGGLSLLGREEGLHLHADLGDLHRVRRHHLAQARACQ